MWEVGQRRKTGTSRVEGWEDVAAPYECLGKWPCPCMHFCISSELLKSVSQSPLLVVLWFMLRSYHKLDETKAQNVLQLLMTFSLWHQAALGLKQALLKWVLSNVESSTARVFPPNLVRLGHGVRAETDGQIKRLSMVQWCWVETGCRKDSDVLHFY